MPGWWLPSVAASWASARAVRPGARLQTPNPFLGSCLSFLSSGGVLLKPPPHRGCGYHLGNSGARSGSVRGLQVEDMCGSTVQKCSSWSAFHDCFALAGVSFNVKHFRSHAYAQQQMNPCAPGAHTLVTSPPHTQRPRTIWKRPDPSTTSRCRAKFDFAQHVVYTSQQTRLWGETGTVSMVHPPGSTCTGNTTGTHTRSATDRQQLRRVPADETPPQCRVSRCCVVLCVVWGNASCARQQGSFRAPASLTSAE